MLRVVINNEIFPFEGYLHSHKDPQPRSPQNLQADPDEPNCSESAIKEMEAVKIYNLNNPNRLITIAFKAVSNLSSA